MPLNKNRAPWLLLLLVVLAFIRHVSQNDLSRAKKDFRALAKGFARRGFVCFSLNYRLVTATDHRFPAQLDDVRRAIRWIRANAIRYGVDPNRLGALGASAGGHLVALLGTVDTRASQPQELSQYSSRVQCVVDMYGPTDLTSTFPSNGGVDVAQLIHQLMDGTPKEKPQLYHLASPRFDVDPATVPFLIFQGALDPLVPVDQSRRMANTLQSNGIPVTYVEFPDEGHGIEKRANREKVVSMTLQFFDSKLRGLIHSRIGSSSFFLTESVDAMGGAGFYAGVGLGPKMERLPAAQEFGQPTAKPM